MLKRFSPGLFGLALICFVLPWVNVSCHGQRIITLTGLQLMTGTAVRNPFGGGSSQMIPGYWVVILLFAVLVLCLAISFTRSKEGTVATLVTSIAAAALTIGARVGIDDRILKEGSGMLQTDFGGGYYLALLFIIGGIGLNALILSASQDSMAASSSPAWGFCMECGARNAPGDSFCVDCGKPLGRPPDAPLPEEVATHPAHCSACGVVLAPGDVFCPNCGAKNERAQLMAFCNRCFKQVQVRSDSPTCPACGCRTV